MPPCPCGCCCCDPRDSEYPVAGNRLSCLGLFPYLWLIPSIGSALLSERVRDEGGHALVVVDDIKPLSDVWEQLLSGLAGERGGEAGEADTEGQRLGRVARHGWLRSFVGQGAPCWFRACPNQQPSVCVHFMYLMPLGFPRTGLGPALLREGLVKDDKGRDMPVVPPPSAAAAAGAAADGTADAAAAAAAEAADAAAAAAAAAAAVPGLPGGDDDNALVEYEGMLVSGAVAQRRG